MIVVAEFDEQDDDVGDGGFFLAIGLGGSEMRLSSSSIGLVGVLFEWSV